MSKQATGMREDELARMCARWPGVTHALKWEVELVFSVANRNFVIFSTLGPDRGRLSFRADPRHYGELSGMPGLAPAPFAASPFWLRVVEPERFTTEELAAHVRRSYEIVRASLSPRLQAELAD